MDEFGILGKGFGFRPQGKSAPMKSSGGDRRSRPTSSSTTFTDRNDMFNDVFGGPPKYTNSNSKSTSSMSDFDYDSIFKDSVPANNNNNNNININETKTTPGSSNSPVYDKPLYDDDVFDNMPGVNINSKSVSARYEDNIFASMAASPSKQIQNSDGFDDLLGDLGRTEKAEPITHSSDKSSRDLDDLIPGFGSSSPASNSRWCSDPSPTSTSNTQEKSNAVDDPFVVLESTPTPVASSQGFFTDPLEQFNNIGKSKNSKSGLTSPDVFADMDPLNSFNKSPPAYSKETRNRKKGPSQTHSEEGSSVGSARSSVSREPIDEYSFGFSESQPQKTPFDHFQESHQTSHTSTSSNVYTSPKSEEHVQHEDDIWLAVSEIPLFTPITWAPPPSRPPPPVPARASSTRTFDNDFSSSSFTKYSQNANAYRSKEPVQVAMDEEITHDRLEREREEEEREQRRLEREKNREIEREKARQAVERANREARERAANEAWLKAERAAVLRAQTEARERAAVEARERAERAAAEKVAAERDAAEKVAADRAAAEKVAAETKEKETREKEKAAVAKAQAEARRRAEHAAVERVTAEARERAAAEALERAAVAAAAKVNQQRNDNDLDSFFSMGSQPNTVPKARTSSNDSATDPLSQDRRGPEGARASSSAGPSNVRKASSTTNFVDDLSSIFGAGMPAGEFQDVEGETEERRRARLERQQRTQERAAKALAEKNQRDLQVQKEQEERHRISATLDVEIKRWASGKEGNLRAMLSTLQYVLWPECGWQPVSLTDLIMGANVKKVYRKATLCIHPDKVQQKGANLQQKYVAEKVFDLLKEAWNKFNSEELF